MLNKISEYTPVLILAIWATVIVGWVLNVVKIGVALFSTPDLAHLSGFIIFRIIGVFAFPVGAVLGYF